MSSLYINSVQPFSITISGTATTGTVTLGTAVGSNAFLLYNGVNASDTVGVVGTINTSVALTNSTTITATRGLHTNSTSATVTGFVVDATSSLVSFVQFGTVTIASGATSGTATISTASTSSSVVIFLGSNTGQGSSANFSDSFPYVTLTNSTTVTAAVNAATIASETVAFCVVTFVSGVLNQNVQSFLLTASAAATADSQTITSVSAGNAILLYNGSSSGDSSFQKVATLASLASSTSVSLTRNTSTSATRTHSFSVVEFVPGVISTQRGSVAIGTAATSATATISTVDTTVTALNYTGFNGGTGTISGKYFADLALTNSTTVTGSIAATGTAVNVGYEAVSFQSGGALTGTAAGAASAVGTLTGAGKLSGSATGSAASSGTLAGAGTLSGSVAGAGSVSGTVSGAGTLTGSASATGSAAGALNGSGVLTGAAAGSGSTSGALTGNGALATGAVGQASASGTLINGAAFTGNAAGQAAATGTLSGIGALASTASGAALAVGVLSATGALAGTASATAVTVVALSGSALLSGAAQAQSFASAALTSLASGAMNGAAQGQGSAQGTLTAAPIPTGAVSLSITQSQVLAALRIFLLQILPPMTEVVTGQDNLVPMPRGSFVTMTPLGRRRLMTNVDTWARLPVPQVIATATSTAMDVQIDLYGASASDNAQIVHTLFRDEFGLAALSGAGFDIAPLYTGECRQMAFINGENQYEDRWSIDLTIQINPTLNVTQDFATLAAVRLISVEATYAP